MILTDDIALYAAFFMEGLRDHDYDQLIEIYGNGCVELVSQLTEFAPFVGGLVGAAVKARDNSTGFPGVFVYEVCSPFGSWVAEYIIEQRRFPGDRACKDWLVKEVIAFFSQMEDGGNALAITDAVTNAAGAVAGATPSQTSQDAELIQAEVRGAATDGPTVGTSILQRIRRYFAPTA